jgi:hypothetical protein
MRNIPQNRLIIYLMLFAFIPLVYNTINFIFEKEHLQLLSQRISSDCQKAAQKRIKEGPNQLTHAKYQDKDQFFLAKKIETIFPLEKEYAYLQSLTKGKYHPEEDAIKRRIDYLAGGQNALSFAELSVKKHPGYTETQEALAHTVEVDLDDLLTILSKIEGVSYATLIPDPERPHMIISDFKIERKKSFAQEIYTLNMQVIKREYTDNKE